MTQDNIAIIESMDHEGRGVTHVNGKTIFIEGAITGERVRFASYRKKPSYEFASTEAVLEESFMRSTPRCEAFGRCGGCSLQHLDPAAQVANKQRILEDNLWHIGKVRAETILPALYGPSWHYRHRARLSARFVEKKGGMLVGFHEKRSSFIVDMHACEILPERISQLIDPLRALLGSLTYKDRIPQVELALGEAVDVLVLRVLEPLTETDEEKIRRFADQHGVQIWLQPKGPATAYPFYPENAPQLAYSLPDYGITMPFRPTEFTQVNPEINRRMVHRAMQLLEPRSGERVLDLFCGLGNFTLPIARLGALVVGVEGDRALTERARANAELNGLAERVGFYQANLFEATAESLQAMGSFDKWLIDPPRDGAVEVVKAISDNGPARIVYVSCNPSTLARDAAVLVHAKGYVLRAAGVLNMFPHTAHVESIAVFERP